MATLVLIKFGYELFTFVYKLYFEIQRPLKATKPTALDSKKDWRHLAATFHLRDCFDRLWVSSGLLFLESTPSSAIRSHSAGVRYERESREESRDQPGKGGSAVINKN